MGARSIIHSRAFPDNSAGALVALANRCCAIRLAAGQVRRAERAAPALMSRPVLLRAEATIFQT